MHSDTEPYIRHARYYLSAASNANELCEGGEQIGHGVALFAQEWPNIECAWRWAGERINEHQEATRLCIGYLRNTGNSLLVGRRSSAMIPLFTAALNAAVILNDRKNESLALSLLGEAYQLLDQYTEAEQALVRCLAISEEILDPFDRDVAASLNNLAGLYVRKGCFHDAEALYKRALAICETSLGINHFKTGISLLNLATLQSTLKLYAEAELLFLRALDIFEKTAGPNHPRTASVLQGLAATYESQGRYAEAEPLLLRSLSVFENALGTGHPSTADVLSMLAGIYNLRGNHREAEELYICSLAVREKAGPESSQSAFGLNELAAFYYNLGLAGKAEPLYRRSLAILEKIFGLNHPSTFLTVYNLAILYDGQQRNIEAEASYRRAAIGFEMSLGPNDQRTMTAKRDYSAFLRKIQRGAETRRKNAMHHFVGRIRNLFGRLSRRG